MNKVITFATLMILALCQSVLSQSGELTLIGTGGAMEKSGTVFLSYSFGEPFISYVQNTNHWLSEGFQQPEKMNVTTAAINVNSEVRLSLFPNPTAFELHIEWKDLPPCSNVQIRNVLGQTILSNHIDNKENFILSLDHFQPGVYWVSIQCGTMSPITQSFIKV